MTRSAVVGLIVTAVCLWASGPAAAKVPNGEFAAASQDFPNDDVMKFKDGRITRVDFAGTYVTCGKTTERIGPTLTGETGSNQIIAGSRQVNSKGRFKLVWKHPGDSYSNRYAIWGRFETDKVRVKYKVAGECNDRGRTLELEKTRR